MKSAKDQLWYACHNNAYLRWQLSFARGWLGAENAALFLADEAGENLVFAASVGRHAERYTGAGRLEDALRVEISAGFGLSSLAFLYGKPMCMEKPDPRHNPKVDEAVGTKTRSLYCVPMVVAEETVGTLGVINVHEEDESARDRFTPEDFEVMQSVAEAISYRLEKEWKRIGRDAEMLLSD